MKLSEKIDDFRERNGIDDGVACELKEMVTQLEAENEALKELIVGKARGTWPDDDGDEPRDWETWSLQLYGIEAGDFLFGQEAWDHIQRGLLGQAHLEASKC